MKPNKLLQFSEFETIKDGNILKDLENLEDLEGSNPDNPITLGLHLSYDPQTKEPNLKTSYWVGLVWLNEEGKVSVRVESRWGKAEGKPVEVAQIGRAHV